MRVVSPVAVSVHVPHCTAASVRHCLLGNGEERVWQSDRWENRRTGVLHARQALLGASP